MSNFKDKAVLITGSSSGIGAATALEFAKQGAKVCINYKENKKGAEDVYNTIKLFSSDSILIHADVSKEDEAKYLVEHTINKLGNLDIVVNNAGKYFDGDEWNQHSEAWQKTLDINLISTLNVSKYAAQYFIENKKGIFVNIASVRGLKGLPDAITYSASKAGIINITQTYARLLAPFGRANSVSPGPVNTGYWLTALQEELQEQYSLIPLGKLAEVDDISNTILFLASDKSRMITGQNLLVDGGFSIK